MTDKVEHPVAYPHAQAEALPQQKQKLVVPVLSREPSLSSSHCSFWVPGTPHSSLWVISIIFTLFWRKIMSFCDLQKIVRDEYFWQ